MNWKEIKETIKEWNKKSLKDYLFPEYVFNKWVFLIMMFMIMLFGLGIMAKHDFDFKQNFYFNCPENGDICENPFVSKDFQTNVPCPVDDVLFCEQPYFFSGYTYGEPPSDDIKNFPVYVFLIIIVAFIINHLLFNIGRKKV